MQSDLDGGGPDVVVGLPSYDLPGKADAGALVVYSNVAGRGDSDPSQPVRKKLFTAADVGIPTQAGARFGAAVVVWRRLGVSCAELLVGAPGQTVGGDVGAGRAYVVRGREGGLEASPRETFDEDRLAGTGGAQRGAGFASALAIDGSDRIAFGVPGRDIGGVVDAGRVVRLEGQRPGANVSLVQQGGSGAGGPETGDRFGEVLHLDGTGVGSLLVVGIPREDVGREVDAGAVALHPPGGPLTMVTQDSPGAAGSAESGDRYGAALDTWATFSVDHPVIMVAVGVPGEDISGDADAGLVSYAAIDLFETSDDSVGPIEGRAATVSQDSPGVPGAVETGDRFGSAVLTGEYGDERRRLVVGAPGENLGSVRDAGVVTVTRIRESGLPASGAQLAGWSQDSAGVSGRAETGDAFGSHLAGIQLARVEDDEDVVWAVVLVTVPGENDGTTSNSGMAHLGTPPDDAGSVPLIPPNVQAGAGEGMVGQRMLVG